MIKRIQKKITYMLILTMFVCLLLTEQTYAAQNSCSISIPLEVALSGVKPKSEVAFKVVIETVEAGNPMPAQTEVTIKNSGTAMIGPLVYTVPGDYGYKIYQKPSDAEKITVDDTIYTLTVRVVRNDADELEAEIWVVNGELHDKAEAIKFTNVSKELPAKPNVPPKKGNIKTGDTTNAEFYVLALLASVAAMFLVGTSRKRER